MSAQAARVAVADELPMSIEQFLAGGHLRRSDVVLVSGDAALSRVIRYMTDSPFSHAALVFLIPQHDKGFEHSFVIEAVRQGVDLRHLSDLLAHDAQRRGTAVSFLRLEAPWFDEEVRSTVRGRMLDFIQAGYSFGTMLSIALAILRQRLLGRPERVAEALAGALQRAHARNRVAPASFICSGLVQYGFLRTFRDLAEGPRSRLRPEDVLHGLFNPRLAEQAQGGQLGLDDMLVEPGISTLLSTTPDEISRAPQLAWKYVATRGQVHAVSSRDEAVDLIQPRRRRRRA
jgi:hypothetical protein